MLKLDVIHVCIYKTHGLVKVSSLTILFNSLVIFKSVLFDLLVYDYSGTEY